MSNLTPLPASLRKRRASRGIVAAVAVASGVALAALAFTLTQPGSASTGVGYIDAVEDGDVTVNALDLGDLAHFATFGDYDLSDPEKNTTMVFTNAAKGEGAVLQLDSITPDEDDDELYESIQVRIVDEDGGTVYQGALAAIGDNGSRSLGTVPADGTLSFDVYAFTTRDATTTDPDAPETEATTWNIDYSYQGDGNQTTGPRPDDDDNGNGGEEPVEGCPPADGPLSGVVQQVSDGIADGDPTGEAGPLVDGIDTLNCELIVTLEGAADGGDVPDFPVP
jgi:hypothetical protein